MNLRTILNSVNSLNEIINVRMEATEAFKLAKITKKLKEHLNDFEEIKKLKIDEFNLSSVNDEGYETRNNEYIKEINRLIDEEIEFEFVKLNPSLIKGEISANIIVNLEWIFEGL